MPPKVEKRNSVAQDGKQKKGYKQDNVDFNQPVIVQNSKNTFSERLEKAREEHKNELEELLMEMESVKKENGRLRRQQEDTYGITMDTVARMKQELERARTTKMFLLEDINIRKEKCEKMEADIFELNMKLESYTKKLNEYRQMKIEWEETSERLSRTEEKCERLTKTNKNMRLLLMKHHIDPKTEAEGGKRQSSQKPAKAAIGAAKVPPPPKSTHSYTHIGQAKKMSRSLEDLRARDDTDDSRRKLALTSRKPMGQGAPAYLGYYTNIHHNRMQIRNRAAAATGATAIHLPKIAA